MILIKNHKKITLVALALFTILFSCKKKNERVIIEKVKLEKGQTFDNFFKRIRHNKSFKKQ